LDTSSIAKQQIKSLKKIEAIYNEILTIDTAFRINQELLLIHSEHYCLRDTELITPGNKYELEEDFKTHQFNSTIAIRTKERIIFKPLIEKSTFDSLLFDELQIYGELMFLSVSTVDINGEDLIRLHYGISIPGTDIGTSATLYIDELGEKVIRQY
jgi:hypothetical protein